MLNTILGTGLLALPTVYAGAGFVTGTLIVLVFGALSTFTNYIFVECALLKGRPTSFTSVANQAFPGSSVLVDLAVILNSLGTSISYIIVATDGFVNVFGGARQLWTIVAIAIAGPLAFLRSMDSLRVTSLLAVACIAYITIVILLYLFGMNSPHESMINPCPNSGASPTACPPGQTTSVASLSGNLGASASLGLAFGAIYSTPPILNEIITPTRGAMLRVAIIAFGSASCLYILVGCSGYATYGDKVEANILNSYPNTGLVAGARLGLSLVTIFSFPIQIFVCRISGRSVLEYCQNCRRRGEAPSHGQEAASARPSDASFVKVDVSATTSRAPAAEDRPTSCKDKVAGIFTSDASGVAITGLFICPALIVALITNNVGAVFNLTGAVGGGLVIFIFPGIMYYRLFPEPTCTITRGMALFCFVLGWVLMLLGILSTFKVI